MCRVHSEHNAEFHALNRRLNEECKQGDWSKKGHVMNAAGTFDQDDTTFDNKPSARVLGGNVNDGTSLRELMYQSAVQRLTKEEQDITDGCGSTTL